MDLPVTPESGELAQLVFPPEALAALSSQKLGDRHLKWKVHIGSEKSSLLLTWEVKRHKGTKSTDRRQTRTSSTASVPGPEKRRKNKSDTQRRRDQRRRALLLARQSSTVPAPSPQVVGTLLTAPTTTRPPPPADEAYHDLGLAELAGLTYPRSATPTPMETGPPSQSELPSLQVLMEGAAQVTRRHNQVPKKQRPFLGPPKTALFPTGSATKPQSQYPGIRATKYQPSTRRPSGTRTDDIFFYARKDNRYVLYRPSHGLLVRCFLQKNQQVTPPDNNNKSLPLAQLERMYPHYLSERVDFNAGGDNDTLRYIYYELEETAIAIIEDVSDAQ